VNSNTTLQSSLVMERTGRSAQTRTLALPSKIRQEAGIPLIHRAMWHPSETNTAFDFHHSHGHLLDACYFTAATAASISSVLVSFSLFLLPIPHSVATKNDGTTLLAASIRFFVPSRSLSCTTPRVS
jgi:hypothetical protein